MIADLVLTVFSTYKIKITELALCSANSVNVIFHVKKTFNVYACHMSGKYAKTKSEIKKHY